MPLAWKDWLKESISAGGSGALTLGSAVSGFQAFAAGDDAKIFPYSIQDGTAWETGYGTYTHSGTTFARTSRTASSTGSALNVSTSGFLFVDLVSNVAQGMDAAAQAVIPGGRLTLTTAVPVTTADVTGATTIYYTPYVHNIISLWDCNRWAATVFAEVSLALGTITNALCYDVFGFLNAGALNTELLAWTSATARATAVTLQDGRYCKSGDKTRLYLGTFYTTATTTTEDSLLKRFVWNMYNRMRRALQVMDATASWTYTTDTWRQANGATGNQLQIVIGLVSDIIEMTVAIPVANSDVNAQGAYVGVGEDSTTSPHASTLARYAGSGKASTLFPTALALLSVYPSSIGYHNYVWLERAAPTGTATWYGTSGAGTYQGGMSGRVIA